MEYKPKSNLEHFRDYCEGILPLLCLLFALIGVVLLCTRHAQGVDRAVNEYAQNNCTTKSFMLPDGSKVSEMLCRNNVKAFKEEFKK